MSKGVFFLTVLSIITAGVWAAVTFTPLFRKPPEISFTTRSSKPIRPEINLEILEILSQEK
jgi:hypothetical protein